MTNCIFCYQGLETESTYHLKCCRKFFGADKLPEILLDRQILTDLAELTVNKRVSLTGVQPKLSFDLQNITSRARLTITGLGGKYILKPQNSELKAMPEVEDLTMHLAELFKIKTCQHALIPLDDGSLAYIAKRFDRKGKIKIHMEDFCQLGEFQTEQKYDSSYERCGKLITSYCTNKGLDLLTFFEVLLFSFLTGNSDMHMKNFSILYLDREIVLSPAYDLINSSLIFPQDKEEMALMMSGRKSNIKLKDFENLAGSLGIQQKVVKRVLNKYLNAQGKVFDFIDRSFLSDSYKDQYKKIWISRSERLG